MTFSVQTNVEPEIGLASRVG